MSFLFILMIILFTTEMFVLKWDPRILMGSEGVTFDKAGHNLKMRNSDK